MLSISYLPQLSQTDYDHLLWSCDLNCVRGEDSLVRALWAGKPLLWQIYPQADAAHHTKLQAFLDWLGAGTNQCQWHRAWNNVPSGAQPMTQQPQIPPEPDIPGWLASGLQARDRLLQTNDLCSGLIEFVQKKR